VPQSVPVAAGLPGGIGDCQICRAGAQQTDAVVVVQGPDGDASQFREFADAIGAAHSSIDNSRP